MLRDELDMGDLEKIVKHYRAEIDKLIKEQDSLKKAEGEQP